jgi:hypothetical protein
MSATTRLTTSLQPLYVIVNWVTMIGTVRRKPSGENEGPCNFGGAPKPPPQSPMSHHKRISKQPQIVHFRGKVEPNPHDLFSVARDHFTITQYKFLKGPEASRAHWYLKQKLKSTHNQAHRGVRQWPPSQP